VRRIGINFNGMIGELARARRQAPLAVERASIPITHRQAVHQIAGADPQALDDHRAPPAALA
jgi:hypothetical protein